MIRLQVVTFTAFTLRDEEYLSSIKQVFHGCRIVKRKKEKNIYTYYNQDSKN